MKIHNVIFLLLFSGLILLVFLIMQPLEIFYADTIPILFPGGKIAFEQRRLLFIIQIIMLFVVIPVYVLTFVFSWLYSAQNKKGKYEPHLEDNFIAECIWWGLPFLIVVGISVLTWIKTYELDPYRPIASDLKPLKIQAVALDWKWLFIFPEEKIAAVNTLRFPEKTPLAFEITADAPMNSLWIPELGGQIYAMPNMVTKLHLIADQAGEFRGSSANLSGAGFAGMHFIAKAVSEKEFDQWVETTKSEGKPLGMEEYKELAKPSHNTPPALYHLKEDELFHRILMKYMPKSEE